MGKNLRMMRFRSPLLVVLCAVLVARCDRAPTGATSSFIPPAIATSTAAHYDVLYRFRGGTDGALPEAGVSRIGSAFYGTTQNGGSSACKDGCGTVYGMSASGKERVLYRFSAGNAGAYPMSTLLAPSGMLDGTTPITSATCPYASSSSSSGVYSRLENCGTIFQVTTSGVERILYRFETNKQSASEPVAGLTRLSGTDYGVTAYGGTGSCGSSSSSSGVPAQTQLGCGTVFAYHGGANLDVIYNFNVSSSASDGAIPEGRLVAYNGTLYGTTVIGGASGCIGSSSASSSSGGTCGTVFAVTSTGAERVVYRFAGGSDGFWPYAGLVEMNGKLYGTTANGGGRPACPAGCGTVFEVTTGGVERVIHAFKGGADGAHPMRALYAINGALWGTTVAGGSARCTNGCGTIFKITASGSESIVHRFLGGRDGAHPESALIANGGMFYGTTSAGGGATACSGGCGTVFSLKP